jgi:hypothetical protein
LRFYQDFGEFKVRLTSTRSTIEVDKKGMVKPQIEIANKLSRYLVLVQLGLGPGAAKSPLFFSENGKPVALLTFLGGNSNFTFVNMSDVWEG